MYVLSFVNVICYCLLCYNYDFIAYSYFYFLVRVYNRVLLFTKVLLLLMLLLLLFRYLDLWWYGMYLAGELLYWLDTVCVNDDDLFGCWSLLLLLFLATIVDLLISYMTLCFYYSYLFSSPTTLRWVSSINFN